MLAQVHTDYGPKRKSPRIAIRGFGMLAVECFSLCGVCALGGLGSFRGLFGFGGGALHGLLLRLGLHRIVGGRALGKAGCI